MNKKQLSERNCDLDIKNTYREEVGIFHTAAEFLDILEASFIKSSEQIQLLKEEF
jgi:hypothetical protein